MTFRAAALLEAARRRGLCSRHGTGSAQEKRGRPQSDFMAMIHDEDDEVGEKWRGWPDVRRVEMQEGLDILHQKFPEAAELPKKVKEELAYQARQAEYGRQGISWADLRRAVRMAFKLLRAGGMTAVQIRDALRAMRPGIKKRIQKERKGVQLTSRPT